MMPNSTAGLRVACAALIVAVLASACDKPKPRPPAQVGGPLGGASAPARAVAPPAPPQPATTPDPLPAAPKWAEAYLGKPLKALFPNSDGACIGNTDVVTLRYQGEKPGVRVEGWGWEPAAKKAVARVLLVDAGGQVVGAGETGVPRPDVVAARKEVTSATSGWSATTAQTSGGLFGYGLLADGKTACRLGHVNL